MEEEVIVFVLDDEVIVLTIEEAMSIQDQLNLMFPCSELSIIDRIIPSNN